MKVRVADKDYKCWKYGKETKIGRFKRSKSNNIQVWVLKAMRHPYIITYRESFMDKKFLCIVMDYADGGDMYKKIEY